MAENGLDRARARRRLGRHRLRPRRHDLGRRVPARSMAAASTRVAHLRPFRCPAASAAIREPRRSALGLLYAAVRRRDALAMTHLAPLAAFDAASARCWPRCSSAAINAPLTSSAGPAVRRGRGARRPAPAQRASRGRRRWSWSAPPADIDATQAVSDFAVRDEAASAPLVIDWEPPRPCDPRRSSQAGVAPAHRSPRGSTTRWSTMHRRRRRAGRRARRVVLTGGCFQNALSDRADRHRRLRAAASTPYWHQRVPAERRRPRARASLAARLPRDQYGERSTDVPRRSRKGPQHRPATTRCCAPARVDFGGIVKEVSLAYVPEAELGDYVLVHVGFAITMIDEAEAAQVFEYLRTRWTSSSASWRGRRGRHEVSSTNTAMPTPRRGYADAIAGIATRPWTIMEVCGGQTHAIVKFGIDELLPPEVDAGPRPRLPGLRHAARADRQGASRSPRGPDVIFCSFGDMLRVPGTRQRPADGQGRRRRRARRLLAARCARRSRAQNPERAGRLLRGRLRDDRAGQRDGGLSGASARASTNFSLLVSHVLVPPAMKAILGVAAKPRAGLSGRRACLHGHGLRRSTSRSPRSYQRADRRHRLRAARHSAGRLPVRQAAGGGPGRGRESVRARGAARRQRAGAAADARGVRGRAAQVARPRRDPAKRARPAPEPTRRSTPSSASASAGITRGRAGGVHQRPGACRA